MQAVSRMECMASWGLPKSRSCRPSREAKIGPMVVPQGEAFCTMGSCRGTRTLLATCQIRASETAFEAQRCLLFPLITGPLWKGGLWFSSCLSGRLGCMAWATSALIM